MTKYIMPPETLKKLTKRFCTAFPFDKRGSDERIISKDGNDFIFQNLEIASGEFEDVRLLGSLLENGAKKNQEAWWQYVSQKNDGIVLPNARILYQMTYSIYALRDNPEMQDILSDVKSVLHQDWQSNYPHTGTRIKYGSNLDTTIEHLCSDGSIISGKTAVPEFLRYDNNWSYLILAKEQPEAQLGNIEQISAEAMLFLELLFGPHYEEAGSVLQYVVPRKNNLLHEIRLWIPTVSNRNAVRALVLGVYDVGFSIDAAGINYDRPARGVVSRKIFP